MACSSSTKHQSDQFKKLSVLGPVELKNTQAKSLQIIGPLIFSNLKVHGETKITGPVEGKDGKFKNLAVTGPIEVITTYCQTLNVVGPVDGSGLHVQEETAIIGPLEAKNSTFKNITVTADTISFENCSANNIFIKTQKYPQTLTLKGETVIAGNIVFESGQGKIVKDKNVQIHGFIKGTVCK